VIEILKEEFEIHGTPLEKICIEECKVTIELDDINEERYIVTFIPYQAIKITTFDCMPIDYYFSDQCIKEGRYHCYILEMTDSPWIKQLKTDLIDENANFLNKSKHFLIPLRQDIIEIVAHKVDIKKV